MSLPVALQLFSVRDALAKDFVGTLKKVKEMGYQGVELAGLSETHNPAEVKKLIEDLGLIIMSSHVPFPNMIENPKKVFEDYKTLGCKYIVIPWLGADEELSEENFDETVQNIISIGKGALDYGLTLLYHNHNFEFVKIDGEYIIDKLYRCVDKKYLQTELDTCWVRVGGEDPAEYVRKYSGRSPLVHLKDFTGKGTEGLFELIGKKTEKVKRDGDFKFRPLGDGMQDIMSIIKASEDAGAEWLIVEQDESPDMPSMEAAKRSREYLLTLGY